MNYVSIFSANEATRIASLTDNAGYWVGVTDNVQEGVYKNLNDDLSVNTFIKWAVGEPNDSIGKDDCILVTNSGFYDHNCDKFMRVLCEIDVPSSSVNIVENLVEVLPPDSLFEYFGTSCKLHFQFKYIYEFDAFLSQ